MEQEQLESRFRRSDRGRIASSAVIMSTRRGAREARQKAPVAAGPLRTNHKAALKKIWDERPCLPSAASRKAWASARGINPTSVNRWFHAQVKKAGAPGFELDTKNEGYDLNVEAGSPVERSTSTMPHLERGSAPRSTTPDGLPDLFFYEYSTSSETGLRILLGPGQSSSPLFGTSFYSPKLTLDSPSGAYGHLPSVERFLFTPPSPPKHKRTTQSPTRSQHFVQGLRTRTHRSTPPLPVSPTPYNRLPPLPLAPKKPRPSRGSHDILNFFQDDPRFRVSPSTSSSTPRPSGYSVSYHIGPRVQEGDDKPNLSTFSDLRTIVAKTSRPTDQKRGGCIGDDQRLNTEIIKQQLHPPSVYGR